MDARRLVIVGTQHAIGHVGAIRPRFRRLIGMGSNQRCPRDVFGG